MKVCVLTSGSKGNSTYIETNDKRILIDAGTSIKYITESLKKIDISLKDINIILITHTHSDHISALEAIIQKYKPIVFITPNMFKEMKFLKSYKEYIDFSEKIEINELTIETIHTSHDAIDSRGYYIKDKDSSLVYITDTGYINTRYLKKISNANIYILESNYDVIKLRNGSYPIWLQNRISSAKGHLSNELSATYLSKLIGPNTKKIILAHLSEENNEPSLALNNLFNTLKNNEIEFDNIECAKQNEMLEVVTL